MNVARLPIDLRVPLAYALFGALWILFSDQIVAALVSDTRTLISLQMYKGWAFVAISAVLIHRLVRHHIRLGKQAANELRRQNRALTVFSACNQALIHIEDEQTLLEEICRICVETGGYRMAWVGYAEHDPQKTVRPIAQTGFEEGYLDTVRITWADAEHGRGPTGTAIRTGQPRSARNIPENPDYAPWRAAAIQRGYRSSIALPLIVAGDTLGALNIYSAEAAAFDAAEVTLLMELAGDLAYGLASLRMREALRRSHDRLRDLSQRLTEAETIERRSLSRELHDSVGQTLTALNINLNIMQSQLPEEALRVVGPRIVDSIHLVEETVECVRDVMANLYPPVLADYGLGAALRWYCERFTRRTEIPVRVEEEGESEARLPARLEAVLYRVAQEALTNVARHACAGHVLLTLELRESAWLRIQDDGRGFDPGRVDTPDDKGGWGLRTMRERIEAVGGSFSLESAPGRGTTISVELAAPPPRRH